MSMKFDEFLIKVIDDGIASAKSDPRLQERPKRLAGSIQGFESCRGKDAEQLWQLLTEANRKAWNIRVDQEDDKDGKYDIEDYWQARYVAIQIEWVCNCVSAALASSRFPAIVTPTARGYMNAARILGVQGDGSSAN